MKNIFKFNRIFPILLLLSVVSNASAVRWFEDGAFAASADITNERFIAAKRTEAQANFARVDAARAAEAAANIAAETALDAANANLMAGFGVSEGHIKAEAPVATQVSNVTVEVPVAAPVASGSRLSETCRVAKLHYQMALDKLTAQENRKTVYAVAGIATVCAVGYGIYKYFSAKSAAPVAAISGESATMPVIGQTATPTRQAPVMITTHKRLIGKQTVIKTPVKFAEFISLNTDLKKDPTNKNILNAMQTGFSTSGKINAGIVTYLAKQFSVANNADAVSAKLAELIAA
ncbi:MAG TPA: hypothetical protein VJJ81_00380 [Candidatus Babeliales bacterium]|nr:hypothetical protein [Candidatus Babeliales bacterium]